jgi:hypothetical protein
MALTGTGLAALVFADHISLFPTAAASTRSNAAAGIVLHNPAEQFINALCEGFAQTALQMKIQDISTGTLPSGGTAPPAIVTFPGAAAAKAELITSLAWVGTAAAQAAFVFVESVLLNTAKISNLVMQTNPFIGTGAGAVSAVSNPSLKATMQTALSSALALSFQANGFFGEADVPGAPVNTTLGAALPLYAGALATGFSSIAAAIAYASPAAPGAAASGNNIGALV